jgi:hypothetical protein
MSRKCNFAYAVTADLMGLALEATHATLPALPLLVGPSTPFPHPIHHPRQFDLFGLFHSLSFADRCREPLQTVLGRRS